MLSPALALLTAVAFAAGALNAHRLPARTVWGDVYGHVPNHLVTAGIALLVAVSLLALTRHGDTARARRAGRLAGGAWGLLSAVFVVDAVGGGIGDRTGEYLLHDLAMLLLPVAALLSVGASVLLVLTRGGWAPWPLRLAALVSFPGALALNEASSAPWLAAGLAAAGGWLLVAAHAARRLSRPAAARTGTAVPVRT